ncbi:histidine kinase [Burkholderiaceae bacterium DAT-1]|nr:histidine kinase [Burkholderiaceae bacterium DAT-1]
MALAEHRDHLTWGKASLRDIQQPALLSLDQWLISKQGVRRLFTYGGLCDLMYVLIVQGIMHLGGRWVGLGDWPLMRSVQQAAWIEAGFIWVLSPWLIARLLISHEKYASRFARWRFGCVANLPEVLRYVRMLMPVAVIWVIWLIWPVLWALLGLSEAGLKMDTLRNHVLGVAIVWWTGECWVELCSKALLSVRTRIIQIERQANEARVTAVNLSQRLSEAQLSALQAQIEPHFLFNSLGAVQELARIHAPDASILTAKLITFLRLTTQQLRSGKATVATEVQIAQHYLDLMVSLSSGQFSGRIHFEAGMEELEISPALLIFLLEDVRKHGGIPSSGTLEMHIRTEGHTVLISLHIAAQGHTETSSDSDWQRELPHRLNQRFPYAHIRQLKQHADDTLLLITTPIAGHHDGD